jgi:hypothetical protein
MKMQGIFKGKGTTVHGKGLFTRVFKTVYRLPFTVYLIIIAALLASGCSQDPTLAGGSSEIGNAGVAGVIRHENGNAAANTEVALIPEGAIPFEQESPGLPKRSLSTVSPRSFQTSETDNKGQFAFDDVDPGTYNIIARNTEERTAALLKHIEVPEQKYIDTLEAILLATASFTVYISDLQAENNGLLYIPGTDVYAEIGVDDLEAGTVSMENVPPAIYSEVSYVAAEESSGISITNEDISLRSGEESVIGPFASWSNSKKIIINTTSTGADVAGDVHNFPVLIRLSSSSSSSSSAFEFTQVEADGADLRFTKSDKVTPLAYEIESWDYVNGQAAVWVKMDTVYGDIDSQYIYMYTGKNDAPAQSSGPAVFDTAAGFTGIWHLADNADNAVAKDALGRNNGIMKSADTEMNTSDAAINGIVGTAVDFKGRGDIMHWIDLGADKPYINNVSEITLSLWMNADVDTFESKELLNFSIGGPLSSPQPESRAALAVSYDRIVLWARATDSGYLQPVSPQRPFNPKQWYHVTGVIKIPQDSIYLYVNGEQWEVAAVTFNAEATDITNSTASSMGANDYGKDDYFYGMIDEARLEVKARSPEWIKLSYENQKENSTVVRMED